MNVQLLIEAIVRQTTVLIAQLATSGGARAPLAEIANQVFLELVRELESQGVSRKVAADMFGLGLRTYRRKIQRVSESSTVRGRSLWEAVYDFLRTQPVATRNEVLERFHRDDEELVRGVLQDLTESGIVFRSGVGQHASYRAATQEEIGHVTAQGQSEGLDTLVWAVVYREGPVDGAALARLLGSKPELVGESVARLIQADRLHTTSDGRVAAHGLVLPVGSAVGWEAAVFDHVQAMVQTICSRLRQDAATPTRDDRVGGSTYTLEVWTGHPLEEEALEVLADFRRRLSTLRERIAAYNAGRSLPSTRNRVVVYAGQCVLAHEDDAGASAESA